jgi:hypothetical protein
MTDVTTEQAVMVQKLPKIPLSIYSEHSLPASVPTQLMLCLLTHTMAKTFGNGVSSLFLWSFLSCMDEIHYIFQPCQIFPQPFSLYSRLLINSMKNQSLYSAQSTIFITQL